MPPYKLYVRTRPNDFDYNSVDPDEVFDNYKDATKKAIERFSSLSLHGRQYSFIDVRIIESVKKDRYTVNITKPLIFSNRHDAEVAENMIRGYIEEILEHRISDDFIKIQKEKLPYYDKVCCSFTYDARM